MIEIAFRRRSHAIGAQTPASPALDCQTAFQKIANSCVDQLQAHRKTATVGDPDAIHKMRMALTRLRAATLFFPMTNDDAWRRIKKEMRWLNTALGRARDHDVTMSYARHKLYRHWAKPSRSSLTRSRNKSHRQLSRKLAAARYDDLITAVKEWIENGPWLAFGQSARFEGINAYSRAHLQAWRTMLSYEGRHLRDLHQKRLHRLRIRCKHYRYIVAALQSLGVIIARQDLSFSKTAERVHDALGDLRDLKRLRSAAHNRPPGYRTSKRKLIRRAAKAFRK